jgi:D-arabinose 1-dehydrogenase-like Zn-dependent alcohol dehydrogenase
MHRLPPALAAAATPRILELLGDGPGRVLELGFAGIHAQLLELAGWEVVVVETDPSQAERARQRGAQVVERSDGRFDAVVAASGTDLAGIDAAKIVLVDERGHASMAP